MKKLTDLVQDYFLFPLEGKEKYALGLFDGLLVGHLARDIEQGKTDMALLAVGIITFYHAAFGGIRYLHEYSHEHNTPSSKTISAP